jgi:hypothetical protein
VTGEILRGSLIERMVHHSSGCTICASGGGHPLWVLTVGYAGGGPASSACAAKNPLPYRPTSIARKRSPRRPRPSPDSRLGSGYALPSSRIRRHFLILIDALFSSCLPRSILRARWPEIEDQLLQGRYQAAAGAS